MPRAVENQSAPIPEEITSELGRIINMKGARPMRAVKESLTIPLRAKWENLKALAWATGTSREIDC